MSRIIFLAILFAWLLIGFIGLMIVAEDRKCKCNFAMLVFILLIPFLPFIANACGL